MNLQNELGTALDLQLEVTKLCESVMNTSLPPLLLKQGGNKKETYIFYLLEMEYFSAQL